MIHMERRKLFMYYW